MAAGCLIAGLILCQNCQAAPSVAVPELISDGAALDCHGAAVSQDGRYVIFVSRADNLVTNDNNNTFDVFVRDRVLGTTALVSVNRFGLQSGNGASLNPSMSADGRFVAFESSASDLVSNDTNKVSDIFLRDLVNGTTTVVSVPGNGILSFTGPSSWPVMTPDGRFVLFESLAGNLATNDINASGDLFVRDLLLGLTTLVTRDRLNQASARGEPYFPIGEARISDDGRWVAFESAATNLVANDTNARRDVFVRDLLNATNFLVSVNTNGAPGNNHSIKPALSADGRFVAFQSLANDLVPNDRNGTNDVFLRDLALGTTTLVSINQAGNGSATNSSFAPVINADGRYVGFQSLARDLVGNDNLSPSFVPALDVFLRDTVAATTLMASVHSAATANGTNYYTNWTSETTEPRAWPVFLTRDGTRLGFRSSGLELTNVSGSNLVMFQPGVFVFNRTNGTTTRFRAAAFPALSEDGSTLVCESPAREQISSDPGPAINIFAFDLSDNSAELISRSDPGLASLTGNGRSQLTPGSLSASGRFVAFDSLAANLTANDTNGTFDVFVRDLITGANVLASANADGTGSGRGPSRNPILSGDGRWVAFETVAEPPSGLNNRFTLVARDLAQGTNLSVAPVSAIPYPSAPATPSWSADGRYLVFRSSAPGIVPGVTGNQIYFRDLTQPTNALITRSPAGPGGSGPSWTPLINTNGSRVFFLSTAGNLVTNTVSGTNLYLWDGQQSTLLSVSNSGAGFGQVLSPAITPAGDYAVFLNRTNLYVWSLTQAVPALVVTNASAASLSANGRFIALESTSRLTQPDTNSVSDIFLYDRLSNNFALVSVKLGATGSGNGKCSTPLITPDAHYVLFASQATNLVSDDTNGFTDLFLRDLSAGTTLLLSRNYNSTGSGVSLSVNPVMSPDGQLVIFESYASDLAAGDFNQTKDLFAVRLSAGDSDGDGMADDFELAYFGDLSRDGAGDFDGDGQTDLAEYRAGTNPADLFDFFRAITISKLNPDHGVTVLWSAVPGRTYRVQYKDGLEVPAWTDLAGDVVATSVTGTKVDGTASIAPQRFYRILALPW